MFNKKERLKQNQTKKTNKSETSISLRMPEEVPIELVQGSGLRQYELFQFLFAFFATCSAGFWISYIKDEEGALFWSSIIFTLSAILFLGIVLYRRRKVFNGKITKRAKISDFK